MLGGVLIIMAMLVIGAFLTTRLARRRDQRVHDEFVRSRGEGGGSADAGLPAFMFFGSAASSEHNHDHHPGGPTGDWPSVSDGGESGGAGASGSFDGGGGGSSDGGGGGDGGGGDGGGGGGD